MYDRRVSVVDFLKPVLVLFVFGFVCFGCVNRQNPDPVAHPTIATAVNLEKQNKLIIDHYKLQQEHVQLVREQNKSMEGIAAHLAVIAEKARPRE
jgi:hypothetical protein